MCGCFWWRKIDLKRRESETREGVTSRTRISFEIGKNVQTHIGAYHSIVMPLPIY